jgi:predicted ArsR family transcriptional regulator
MTAGDPPANVDLATGFSEELTSAPADERVYRVALQLYDSAGVSEIAERASCAPDTARRHLKRLADIGVVELVSETPVTYVRNESYFEWRLRDRLEEQSMRDLRETLADLTSQEQAFRERFGADAPTAVDALDHADYDDIEDVWLALSEWQTVRRRIERLEAVRQKRADDPSFEGEPA